MLGWPAAMASCCERGLAGLREVQRHPAVTVGTVHGNACGACGTPHDASRLYSRLDRRNWGCRPSAGQPLVRRPSADQSLLPALPLFQPATHACPACCSMQVAGYMVAASNGQVADIAAAITAFDAEDLQSGYTT